MEKVEVGHLWDVPEGILEVGRIGGYSITSDSNGVYISGKKSFNINEAPIMPSTLMPCTKEYLDSLKPNEENPEGGINRVFNLKDDIVYYLVTNGVKEAEASSTFIFDDFHDAINLLGMFVDFKAKGLLEDMNEKDF